ncbi:uncharacterized protein LOC131428554 [Malaya genurostris]|uniref:uncharacterized protein LOC131428554 n=1 Tax=Malaya genurostris TaxID=325434 RepID=UPI0026F396DB|nr:uncharacterized protein LOC131428554 [Malaya genurostris]
MQKLCAWIMFLILVCPGNGQFGSENLMLPNERETLDDCQLRFHQLYASPLPKPAFGRPALLKEFAHMGAIGWTQKDGNVSWLCGGTLIWYDFVLTAAHCAQSVNGLHPDVVRFGDLNIYSSDDDKYAQQISIAKIIRFPEHRFATLYHDIALIKLEKNITVHDTVVPACLWTDDEIRFRTLEATGWGKTGFGLEQTPVLLKVTLKPIDNVECKKVYTNETIRKLRFGLQDHHMCAVDEKMDTCEGDSGGPLQTKLLHNGRVTPFVVGITSFGTACGNAAPGVYTKIGPYLDWIVETMQKHGADVDGDTYNATFCSLRFVDYREYEDSVITYRDNEYASYDSDNRHMFIVDKLPSHVVKLDWDLGGHENCYGVIFDETTVLTLAQCAAHAGEPVKHIIYSSNGNDTKVNVSEIHIHPKYTEGSGYYNIAILLLSNLIDIYQVQPTCIVHGSSIPFNEVHLFGYGRKDINSFWYFSSEPDPAVSLLRPRVTIQNATECRIPSKYSSRIEKGLTGEHICVGNDMFLVPESCEAIIGGIIDGGKLGGLYPLTFGLNQFGRDCGFGEHSIATGLASHVEWMKSVLLPNLTTSSDVLHYIDSDLHAGDSCTSYNGDHARCVPIARCSKNWKSHLSSATIRFCSSSSVVCCPLTDIENSFEVHSELAECPNIVSKLKPKVPNGSLVYLGWVIEDALNFNCIGTIITKKIILTTASCLGNSVPNFVRLAGNATKLTFETDASFVHSAFNATDNSNDIGLVRLIESLEWSSFVYPSCLWMNRTHTPLVLEMIIPSGPEDVFFSRLRTMYNSDCQRTHGTQLKEYHICARDFQRNVTCVSIPSYLQWERRDRVQFVIGFATDAPDCDSWNYMLFTRVSAFVEWISNVL